MFPGVREETIEFIMFKLAVERGMFTVDGEDHSASTDNFTLFTSVYEIQQELKKRFGASSDSLSYAQVREALEVLQETTYHLRCPATDTDLKFQLLSEFGQMPKAKEGNAQNATLYIRFNAMVAKSILAKSWRAINYESVLKDEVYLSRWLRKMLGLKFTYAAANTTFNIKLTSLINLSGLTPSSALRDNLAYVKRVLASLDIVSRVVITPQRSTNSATRRKVLSDALIVIYPSPSFVTEQIKSNSHTQKLARAVISDTGKPLVEPERRDFQTYAEFAAAKKAYLTAQLSRL